jgi:hypothetical protein
MKLEALIKRDPLNKSHTDFTKKNSQVVRKTRI